MQARGLIVGPLAIALLILLDFPCNITAAKGRDPFKNSAATGPTFKPDDFIVVINTEQARLQLALASRPLRAGLRTFIAVDNLTLAEELNQTGYKYNETYAYFPNRNITGPERSKPGDTRWQAAPFMAHHHYGPTYKWILLGDDDTLWFMLGVKRLLYGYDHDMPYAISDHFGDHNARGFFLPSPLAAVCSPCHWPDLLRSHHREDLLPYSSAVLTRQEVATWNPREVDAWGVGKMKIRISRGGGANTNAAGQERQGRGSSSTRQRRAAAETGSDDVHNRTTSNSMQHLQYPVWGRRGQEPINMTAVLDIAYYSTAPGFEPAAMALSAATTTTAATSAAVASATSGPTDLLPPPIPPPGCPCRPSGACLHRARVCRGRGRGQELCSRTLVFKIGFRGNRSWCRHSWAHGGAGVVLSLGLMRATAGGPVEACARATQVHSCDMNLAMCLMNPEIGLGGGMAGGGGQEFNSSSGGSGGGEAAAEGLGGGPSSGAGTGGSGGGFMFTHPGSAALRGANWADPRFILFDNPVYQRVLHDPLGLLDGRVVCDRDARVAATAAAAALALRAGPEAEEEGGGEGQRGEGGNGGSLGAAPGVEGRQLLLAVAAEGAGGNGLSDAGGAGWSDVQYGGEVVGRTDVPGRYATKMEADAGNGGPGDDDEAAAIRQHKQHEDRVFGFAFTRGASEGRSRNPSDDTQYVVRFGRGLRKVQDRVAVAVTSWRGAVGGAQGVRLKRRDGDLDDIDDDKAICGWLVRHAVSLHMHGRSYASYDDAARAMTVVVRRHMSAVRRLRDLQQQQGQKQKQQR
ncbi:hypothetical protein Vafri_16784 [Volvox africanus]|uniref:Uncharacterized protein n=1 Tax=Volvox africanus TaxID=51714 RepID=A0A8J4BJ26_9CHLO|nr:hypothetical protein Vafri_16784 [Volvox africanus]